MDPLDYLDYLLNGDAHRTLVPCPDCAGQGWNAHQVNAWWPPEQQPCDRCDASGSIPEHELTEREGLVYEPIIKCWADEDSDEEQDDPDGLLDDDSQPTDVSDDGPPSLGVSH